MLTGSCHCGAVRIDVPAHPQTLIDCNCSICRRNGALWALYETDTVRVIGHPEHTTEYVWGRKTIKTIRCNNCGNVTHWEPLQPGQNSKVGVNMRNFDSRELATVRIRRFDGGTWSFVDSP